MLVNSKNYIQIEIDKLIELNYLNLSANADELIGFGYLVTVTEKGKHYFEDKEALIAKQKKVKRIKKFKVAAYVISYLITTGIAIAALVVSIIK